MTLRVLAVPSGLIPPAIIGVLRPLTALEPAISLRLELPTSWGHADLDGVDVVVFSRNNDDRSVGLLQAARQRGIATIYEIDDDFFELPSGLPGTASLTSPRSLRNVLTMLRGADRVHTYSALMVERLAALGIEAHRAPVYFDHDLLAGVEPVPSATERVVFASGRIDEPELDSLLTDVMSELLDRRPGLEVHLWRDPGALAGRRGIVRHPPGVVYSEFVRELARLGALVGLAPLATSTYYQAKTNNKFREYSGCGIAGVYSDVPVYRECVADGVTGLLVENSVEAWVNATERLLDSPPMRRSIVSAAAALSRREFAREASSTFWAAALEQACARPRPSRLPVTGEPVAVLLVPSASGTLALSREVLHVATVLRGPVVAGSTEGVAVLAVRGPEDVHILPVDREALVVDATALPADLLDTVCELVPSSAVVLASSAARPSGGVVRPHPWSPETVTISGRHVVLVDPDRLGHGVDSWGYGLGVAYDLARTRVLRSGVSSRQPVRVRAVVKAAEAVSLARALGARSVTLLRQPPAVSVAQLRSLRLARTAPRRWNEDGVRDL